MDFSLAATFRGIDYASMNLKLLNFCNCSNRIIKMLEDSLTSFPFDMLVYNLHLDLLKQPPPLLSLVHVHCSAHIDTKQQSYYFFI